MFDVPNHQIKIYIFKMCCYVDYGFMERFNPRSIIYGGHGSTTLGHEMVHGFDNNGKAYDKDGFKLNWWTKKEEKDYANRTKCLVNLF